LGSMTADIDEETKHVKIYIDTQYVTSVSPPYPMSEMGVPIWKNMCVYEEVIKELVNSTFLPGDVINFMTKKDEAVKQE
jgi:hypothetical protein